MHKRAPANSNVDFFNYFSIKFSCSKLDTWYIFFENCHEYL